MRGRVVIGAVAALVVAAAVGALIASRGPDPNAVPTLRAVEARISSPFCAGLMLSECPHPQSAKLRGEIESRITDGATNAEIDEWLVANYGPTILGRPAGMLPWAVPALLLAAGAGAIVTLALRSTRKRAAPEAAPDISENDRTRLSSELDRFAQEGAE